VHSPYVKPDENQGEYAQVGMVLDLLLKTSRKTLSISTIDAFLVPAIRLKQIELALCSYRKLPRGMLTYAFLSEEKLGEFEAGHDPILHLSEWNEGTNFFVMDLLCPFGDVRNFLKFSFANLKRKPEKLYFRSQKTGDINSVTAGRSGLLKQLVE